jgi:hypothetical protein
MHHLIERTNDFQQRKSIRGMRPFWQSAAHLPATHLKITCVYAAFRDTSNLHCVGIRRFIPSARQSAVIKFFRGYRKKGPRAVRRDDGRNFPE